ncbi:MAG: thioredoxin domain-containing protein [Candidatus Omnitrophica bacterium]|nr:thioredoxin domain-containing protein [Candidatus Omnitrophota bacterium]
MENKNNAVVVLLVIVIGVLLGIGLLMGIGNTVGVAISPLNAKVTEIAIRQKYIEDKLALLNNGNNSSAIDKRLADVQSQLTKLDEKMTSALANQGQRQAQPPAPPSEDFNKVYDITIGSSPIIGKKDAPITIVEFSDFQCPFCSRFYPVVKDVLAAYPGRVQVIVKNFPLPFHPNARPAAKLALAANEQGKFQGMMENLLANGGDVSDAKIKEYAKTLGLDYNKLIADYKNKDAQWEKQIQDDMQLGSKVDVRGTPTFYLNGHKTMARDINSYKAEIDKILAGGK